MDRLLQELGSKDWKVATQAQQSLVRLGSVALLPVCEALARPDAAAWRAAWVLGRMRDRRAVPHLSERLLQLRGRDPKRWKHRGERQALLTAEIAEALGRLGDPRGVEALCAAFWSPNRNVRQHARTALWNLGRGAVPYLCAHLEEIPVDVLASVVNLLSHYGDATAVKPLCGLLEHGDDEVRLGAVWALGHLAPKYPVVELRQAVPILQRGQRPWSLASERYRVACRDTLQKIERATGHLQDVPVPSAASPSVEGLPLPASGATELTPLPVEHRPGWLARLRRWLRKDGG